MRRYILAGTEGPERLRFEEVPEIAEPGPGEVRVRVRAVSLNYRDLLIAKGLYPLAAKSNLVPASDGAGEVVSVGLGVEGLAPGDRVMTHFFPDWAGGRIDASRVVAALGGSVDGVLAEEVVLPARAVVRYPAHLSFAEAATLPCAAVTAWNALIDTAAILPGHTVLVQGTGGVSSFALQFAKLAGATVIQTSSSDEKLAEARARGADHLINYIRTPEWDVEARRLTDGRGVDVVVEVGGAGTLERSIRATCLGGTVATVGLVGGLGQIDPLPILLGVVRMAGVLVGSHDMSAAMCSAIAAAGCRPLIDRRFAFDEVAEAFRHLESGSSRGGKIVIEV